MTTWTYLKFLLQPITRAAIEIPNMAAFKAIAAIIITFFEVVIFQDAIAFSVLVALVLADWATGVWKAMKNKTFSSSGFRATAVKMFFYTIIVAALHNLERISPTVLGFLNLDIFSLAYFSITEFLSMSENITGISTVRLPSWITSKLKSFLQTGQMTEDKPTDAQAPEVKGQ